MNQVESSSNHRESFADQRPSVSPPPRIWMTLLMSFTGMAVVSIAFVAPFDGLLSDSLKSSNLDLPGDLSKFIGLAEVFGHFTGPIVIFATLMYLDSKRRRILLQMFVVVLIASATANGAKAFFDRVRPHSISDEISQRQLASSSAGASVEQTTPEENSDNVLADGWDFKNRGTFWESSHKSFPSGHSATAVSFAIALALIYRRGWWIFISIGVLACFQRLYSGAHFPTDVLAGAGIGTITMTFAVWIMRRRLYTGQSNPKLAN